MNRPSRTAVAAGVLAVAYLLACSPEARAQCTLYGQDFQDQNTVSGWSAGNGANAADTWIVESGVYHRKAAGGGAATFYGEGLPWTDYLFSCNFSLADAKTCSLYEQEFQSVSAGADWAGGGANTGDSWQVDPALGVYHRRLGGSLAVNKLNLASATAWKNYRASCDVTFTVPPPVGQTASVAFYCRYQGTTNHAKVILYVDSTGSTLTPQFMALGAAYTPITVNNGLPFALNKAYHISLAMQDRNPTVEITPPSGAKLKMPLTEQLPFVVAQGPIAIGFDPGTSGIPVDSAHFSNICVDDTVSHPAVSFYARCQDSTDRLGLTLRDGTALMQVGTAAPVSIGSFTPFDTDADSGSYKMAIGIAGQILTATLTSPSGKTFSFADTTIPSGITHGGIGLGYEGNGAPEDGATFDDVCVGGASVPSWKTCVAIPNLVGPVGAGELQITVTFDTTIDKLVEAYLIPQGVKKADREKQIKLNGAGSGNSTFTFLNPAAITTFMLLESGATPDMREKAICLDGHAVVDVTVAGTSITPSASDQAYIGRHLLIDTIPPEVTAAASLEATTVDDYLYVANEDGAKVHYAALNVDPLTFPNPAALGSILQLDNGILSRYASSPLVTQFSESSDPKFDPTAIYNIGSQSNISGGQRWYSLPAHQFFLLRLQTEVKDDSVFERYKVYNMEQGNAWDEDSETHSMVRQTAGLWVSSPVLPFSDATSSATLVPLTVSWQLDQTIADQVAVTLEAPVGNPGFFDAAYASRVGNPAMDLTPLRSAMVRWRFTSTSGVEGIPLSNQPKFPVEGTLVVADRAKNKNEKVPKLHVYWLAGDDVMAPKPTDGVKVGGIPTVSWELKNPISCKIGPKPLYTFAVWRASEAGEENRDFIRYERVLDWQPWREEAVMRASDFDQTTADMLKGHNVILVSAAMDAAGNMTPWNAALPPLDADGGFTINALSEKGDTWVRFYVPAESTFVDTSLDASFAYTNPTKTLGAAKIIQYPPTTDRVIIGNFDIGLVTGLESDLQYAFVVVELEQDGRVVYRDALLANRNDTISLSTPDILESEPGGSAELARLNLTTVSPLELSDHPMGLPPRFGRADRVVDYVFRAYTVVQRDDGSGNWILPPIVDTSPAGFSFKVVPRSIGNFLQSSGGEQPIKVYERE